jgi:hypothetical protein
MARARGTDPVAAAEALGEAIYYVDARDTRLEPEHFAPTCNRDNRSRHPAHRQPRPSPDQGDYGSGTVGANSKVTL